MCGIAGEVCFENEILNNLQQKNILDTLKRRGPDADGIYCSGDVTLLHARLAVVDIENGTQPMKYDYKDSEYTVVYNGELYNTEEIRKELVDLGEHFKGHSDTEVLLRAYCVWKEKCLERLNGIFAFAIWNDKTKNLFFARDRMGVKPFFYSIKGDNFIFASEIKGLLAHPKVEPILSYRGISELFFLGPGRTPGCGVFEGINEILPGYCGNFNSAGFETHAYWTLQDKEHNESLEETVEKVRYLVTDSIEKQLVSDVPIGTFLSGGLDSSIISAITCNYLKKKGEKLKTFSVNYANNEKYFIKSKFQPDSDDKYINIMADFLGSEHLNITIGSHDLANALYASVDARDLPGMADIDSSLLLFCGEIKKHVTVALSGECADEIFGGYPWFRDEKIRSAYGFPWAQSTEYRSSFLSKDLRKRLDGNNFVDSRYNSSINNASKLDGLTSEEARMREMVYLNMQWFMQTLLDRKDRMSMYHGLEVRVPFCDHRIAEYLYSTPWEMKNLDGREKGLLRFAMESLLPESIIKRKKSPYPKTHNPEYLSIVRGMLQEVIDNKNSPIFELVDKNAVKKLIKTDRSEPWYGQLMTTPQTIAYFLQLNYWLEKYKVRINI
ncbi:MAG: asparagine synthase (glutamine-hydrolyzing) [Clostridiales bacterium GWF2_36_10]|nr:MAG: asparagine synthase (glutamine-hydrolyzing) [Clostridiales bacterium GWF2_36_10]HAN20939.1 asparagine synthase (glutamine-hydrolyzing) [Clostridiales bacterium]